MPFKIQIIVFDYYLVYDIEQRFYSRRTISGMQISPLAKIPTLYNDWLRSLTKGLIICVP